MNTFSLRKRLFLSPASTGSTAYILAEVESSHGGEYKWGHYMLSLADCRQRVDLEFFMSSSRARRRSLAKIDLLIEQLNIFRTALLTEAKLIAEHERRGKGLRKKAQT